MKSRKVKNIARKKVLKKSIKSSSGTTVSDKDIAKLKRLIASKRKNEIACANFLKDFAYLLVSHIDCQARYVQQELTTSAGRIDLVVFVAHDEEVSGETYTKAYIWELKAPQHHLYDINKMQRGQPSIHLWEAENQLICYHYEFKQNGRLNKLLKVEAEHVQLGGVIIGNSKKIFKIPNKVKVERSMGQSLANEIHKIRKSYIPREVKIMTWSDILRRLEKFRDTSKKSSLGNKGKVNIKKKTNKTRSRVVASF